MTPVLSSAITRFLRWLTLIAEAMDATESSILAERIVGLESEVAALRAHLGVGSSNVPS